MSEHNGIHGPCVEEVLRLRHTSTWTPEQYDRELAVVIAERDEAREALRQLDPRHEALPENRLMEPTA